MPETPGSITRDEVAHLANLARIDLSDAELDHLAPQLSVILESVAAIQGVAGDDIPPTSHALPLTNVFRDDVVVPGLTAEQALSGAPASEQQRFSRPADPGGRAVSPVDWTRRTAAELADALASGETTSVELTRAHLDRIAEVDGAVHAFLHVDAEGALAQAAASDERRAAGAPASALDGVPIAVKDVLATEGLPTTCGSKILEGWVPPYDATVVARLRAAGLPILGKTNMDEFAMGSSTEHSAYGPTHNPWDLDRIPGGSGGGSAAAVAAFEAPLAIGTDTGGSIRQPGAVTGTVGVKPTYGGVSRYGLVALANSLDQAGPVTRTVLDSALLHEIIGGHDPLDSTSVDAPLPALVEAARQGASGDLTGVRIGVVTELGGEGYQAGVLARFRESVDLMVAAGAEVVEVSCPSFVHALAAYYLILPAEASSNLAKFDAMRYGLRVLPEGVEDPSAEEVMRATRDAGFGDEVKRRIILGTYALSSGYYDAYYGQAQKVRTLITPRLRRRVREGRRAGQPHRAHDGVPAGGEARRPAGDVPQRPRHHPRQPLRRPRHLGAERSRRGGRPAHRRTDPRPGAGRRPGLPGRRRAGGAAGEAVGRPAARPGARARPSRRHALASSER